MTPCSIRHAVICSIALDCDVLWFLAWIGEVYSVLWAFLFAPHAAHTLSVEVHESLMPLTLCNYSQL